MTTTSKTPPTCPGKGTDGGQCYGVAQFCPSHPDYDEPLPDGGYIEHRTVRSIFGGFRRVARRRLPNGKLAGRIVGGINGGLC